MRGHSSQTKSDKRLRRNEREASRLRGRIQRLNNPLQGGGLSQGHGDRRGGSSDANTQDLFAWGARQKKFKQAGSISLRRSVSHTAAPGRHGRSKGQRLGQFLYSGSFGRLTPMRQGESVHRNRIMFVLLVLSLVAYVVYHITVD